MKRGQFIVVAVFIGICGCEHKDTPATVAPAIATATPADTGSDGGTAVTTKLGDGRTPDLAVATAGGLRPESVRVQRALRVMHMPTMPNGAINRETVIQPPLRATKPPLTSSPAPAAQKQ